MSQAEIQDQQRAVYKRIKINRLRLDGCKRHRFDLSQVPIALGAKAVCLECTGEMPVLELAQYVRGYMAAGGDPNAVCAGYWPEGVALGMVHCPACNYVAKSNGEACGLCNSHRHVEVAQAIAFIEAL